MSSMLPLLADGAGNFPWPLTILGRLHPAIVHFPIALLLTATLFELMQSFRKKSELAPGAAALTVLGAVSAVFATVFGWFLEESDGVSGSTFDLHKWLGIGTMVLTLAAAGFAWKAKSGRFVPAFRSILVLCSVLIGAVGYLGAELTFGENHIFKGTPLAPKPPPPPPAPPTGAVGDKIDFARDIAPILKASCLECHGPKKVKGKFRLDTKEAAFKGGIQKNSIVPGNPDKSLVFTLLNEPVAEDRMPPDDKGPLPKDKIELIRKWIAEGAVWPDGVLIQ